MTVQDGKLDYALRLDERSLKSFEAGSLEDAELCCREALSLFEELNGPVHPDTANLLQRLAAILDAQCQYGEAEACAARAVAIMDQLAPAIKEPEVELVRIEALRQWGVALRHLGRYAKADPPLRRAVMLAEQHADPGPLARALNELGTLCQYTGQLPEGARILRRALAISVGLFGMEHATVATIYRNLGALEHARGKFRIGEKEARRGYEIRRELLGADHPETIADECAWARLLDGLGRYKESRPIYQRALSTLHRHYGMEHVDIAATLHSLSAIDVAECDLESAVDHAARALAMRKRLLGKDHPECMQSARHVAWILRLRVAAARVRLPALAAGAGSGAR